jgi:putative redox protein
MAREVVVTAGPAKHVHEVSIGPHRLHSDEPSEAGGHDAGPNPYELLLAALGTCTAITVQMFADRRRWPLRNVRVQLSHARVHAEDCMSCETGAMLDHIDMSIAFEGDLSDEQRQRLMSVAAHCPVHNTLSAPIQIAIHA